MNNTGVFVGSERERERGHVHQCMAMFFGKKTWKVSGIKIDMIYFFAQYNFTTFLEH